MTEVLADRSPTEPQAEDFSAYAPGLKRLRRRRWFLWITILVYLPAIWLSLRLTHSDRATFKVFLVWMAFTGVAAYLTAFTRCPRCGNFFHMRGLTPLYLRKCLHCELHLTADRQPDAPR